MWKILKIFLGIIFVILLGSTLYLLYLEKPQKPEVIELNEEKNESVSLFKDYTIQYIKPSTISKPLLPYEIKEPTSVIENTNTSSILFEENKEIQESEIVIKAKEFEFIPSQIKVKASTPVLIIFKNEGNIPFDLKIVGENWSVKTELISPGNEYRLEIKFPQVGEYEFFSTIPIALEKNMKGKIIVEP